MPYVVFQIIVVVVIHNGHGDENHIFFTSLLQITHPSSKAKRSM
jgi:hypothetical protein